MVRDAASNTSQSRRKLDQILCTMHNHLLHNALLTPASLHYIKVMWGDNVPYHIEIFNSARTYHEQLEEYNRERTASPVQVVNNNYTFNIADTSALHEIISKIRKEAQKVEDNAALLKAIDELEQSIGKPSFFQKYQSFISSAANHVTFFGGIASAIKTISNLLSM